MRKINSLLLAGICAIGLWSCGGDDDNNESLSTSSGVEVRGYINSSLATKSVVGRDSVSLKTSFTGDFPNSEQNSVTFYWEQGDKIWLDDGRNASALQTSDRTTALSEKATDAIFKFAYMGSSETDARTERLVYYPGQSASTYNGVTINTAQSQASANSTTHIGTSGDAGIAKATKNSSDNTWTFTLEHKSTYLCFLPIMQSSSYKLTQIKITSANTNIAGSYTLSESGLTETSGSKTITLTVGSFPISTSASQSTNAAYIVMAPGTHQLTIEYTIQHNTTAVTTTVTKTLVSQTYDANTVYTVNDPLTDMLLNANYYMWDAQSAYTAMGGDATFAYGSTDARYYNTASSTDAQNTLSGKATKDDVLNYLKYSPIYWDDSFYWEVENLGAYSGGIWLLKKANFGTTPVNTVTTMAGGYTVTSVTSGRPSSSELSNYFFLPALGYYAGNASGSVTFSGVPTNIGTYGSYWTSTNSSNSKAWSLVFFKSGSNYSIQLDDDDYKSNAYRRFTAQ